MNTFGKMGLLCCLAAVLLAGCGDGDRDVSAVSGAEVSIEQSGEISLQSFTKLAIALEVEEELEALLSEVPFGSIEEVINGQTK